jgi:hypothetical protein
LQLGIKRRRGHDLLRDTESYNAVLDKFDERYEKLIDYEFVNDPRVDDGCADDED